MVPPTPSLGGGAVPPGLPGSAAYGRDFYGCSRRLSGRAALQLDDHRHLSPEAISFNMAAAWGTTVCKSRTCGDLYGTRSIWQRGDSLVVSVWRGKYGVHERCFCVLCYPSCRFMDHKPEIKFMLYCIINQSINQPTSQSVSQSVDRQVIDWFFEYLRTVIRLQLCTVLTILWWL